MNAPGVACLQFLNYAANTPGSGNNAQETVANDLFMSLILAILAEAQELGEMAKGETLDLAGATQTNSTTIPGQDHAEKRKETSAQEAAALMLVGSPNLFQSLLPQFNGAGGLADQGVTPARFVTQSVTGTQNIVQAQKVVEEGNHVSQVASQFITGQNSHQSVTAEIPEPTATEQGGISKGGDQLSSEVQELVQGQQGKGDRQSWEPNKTVISSKNLQLDEKETNGAVLQRKATEEKILANSLVQGHFGQQEGSNETAAHKVSNQAAQIPLKPGEDSSKGNVVLQGSQQGFIRANSLLSPELSKEQADAAVAREVIKQVVDHAHLLVGKNGASLKLQLKPEFLGNLKLTISVEHGMVHAQFTADNAAVANLIEARLPELQHALAERGISWHQLSVSVEAQTNSGGFAHPSNGGTGYQQAYPYAFRGEGPSAQEGQLEQPAASSPAGRKGIVDYLV